MRLYLSLPLIFAFSLGAVAMMPINARATNIKLAWTAPGDDGGIGRAKYYDLRYFFYPLTETNFTAFGIPVISGVPRPSPAGQRDSAIVTSLNPGLTYYFALRSVDAAGNWSPISNVAVIRPGETLDVANGDAPAFSEPRPNPAWQSTRFTIQLPVPGDLDADVFDLSGRRVRRLAFGPQPAGTQSLDWNLTSESGQRVGPGIYLVRAKALGHLWTRRVVVVR